MVGLHHFTAIVCLAVLLSTARAQNDCVVQKDSQGNDFGYCTSEKHPETGESYASAVARAESKSGDEPLGARGTADGAQSAAREPLPSGVELNKPTPINDIAYCRSCTFRGCRETCTWYQFYWVFFRGSWWPVYRFDLFAQYIKSCQCTSPYAWCFNYQGQCTNKYTEFYIFIWYDFRPYWTYVSLPSGCCCNPRQYGPPRDVVDAVAAAPAGLA